MCEPTTLAAGALAMGALSTGLSVVGGLKAAEATSSAARYQAQVADNNRKIADWQAEDARKRGIVAEDKRNVLTGLQMGRQRAVLGSSGSDVNQGSNVDILGDTAASGTLDAITIRSNAEREAYTYQVAGANAGAEAGLQRMKADSAEGMKWVGAGANLLSGASSVADKWAGYKNKSILS